MELINHTTFAAAMLPGALSDYEMIVTVALKCTARLAGGRLHAVAPDEAWSVFEVPTAVEGVICPAELHYGKTAVDIFVAGSAHAHKRRPVRSMFVRISSGSLHYQIDLFGDRRWQKNPLGELVPSDPVPFLIMPLANDRAYGGSSAIDGLPAAYAKNPAGRGYFLAADEALGEPLPNLERPGQHISTWQDQPTPACLSVPEGSSLGMEQRIRLDEQGMPVGLGPYIFQGAIPELIVERDRLGPVLQCSGFDPAGEVVFSLPGPRDCPMAQVTIGPRQARYRLQVSTIFLLPDRHMIAVTFTRSFRYVLEPRDSPRQVELSWPAQGAYVLQGNGPIQVDAPVTAPVTPSIPERRPPELPPTPPPAPSLLFQALPDSCPTVFLTARRTYEFSDRGTLELLESQPPLPDDYELYDDASPGSVASFRVAPEGVYKTGTDVIVQGFAQSYGQRIRSCDASVQVGAKQRTIRAFGRRRCELRDGRPVFSAPDAFERVPLRYESAYGGRDARAEREFLEDLTEERVRRIRNFVPKDPAALSPFLYPRNPSGKGYVVSDDPRRLDGVELPQLEDPDDLLTAERLLLRDPLGWPAQPLPACFDFVHPMWFPRLAMLGNCPVYLPEDLVFPEVARGFLPADFVRPSIMDLPPSRYAEAMHPLFSRTAAPGLCFPFLGPPVHLVLTNIHPRFPTFRVPWPREVPQITLKVRGATVQPKPVIYTILVEPEESRLSVVWCAGAQLPRTLTPQELDGLPHHIDWRLDDSRSARS